MKLLILRTAYSEVLPTTLCASPFAAQAATFAFFAWTVILTIGFWPFFERLPGTLCVAIPWRNAEGFTPHFAATAPVTEAAWTIAVTVLGFVWRFWSWMFPLAEYGWPRYTLELAEYTCDPPSDTA